MKTSAEKIQEKLSHMCACHLGKASGYAALARKDDVDKGA